MYGATESDLKLTITRIFSLITEAEFPNIVHSLDVWHKSKSIKKCLAKVSYLLIII